MTQSFNLIPQAVLEHRRTRRRAVRWMYASVIYAGLVGLGIAGVAVNESMERGTGGEARASIKERIASAQQKISLARDELHKLGLGLEAGRISAERPAWSILLAVLGSVRGERILLDSCSIGMASTHEKRNVDEEQDPGPLDDARRNGFELELRGAGLTQSDVTRFALQLEELGLFDRVSIQEMQRGRAAGRSAITFRVLAKLSGKGQS